MVLWLWLVLGPRLGSLSQCQPGPLVPFHWHQCEPEEGRDTVGWGVLLACAVLLTLLPGRLPPTSQVVIDKHPVRFFVHKRPHVDFFLEVVSLQS